MTYRSVAIRAYFDGACEPINPGGTIGFGAVIFDYAGKEIWNASGISRPSDGPEQTSSNVAEYTALLAACTGLIELGIQNHVIEICGDSRMVIEQMAGRWKIIAGAYVAAARRAQEMLRQFPNARLVWIPRDKNRRADELSKRGLIEAGIGIRPARGKRRAA